MKNYIPDSLYMSYRSDSYRRRYNLNSIRRYNFHCMKYYNHNNQYYKHRCMKYKSYMKSSDYNYCYNFYNRYCRTDNH